MVRRVLSPQIEGVEALSSFRREHARNGLQRPAGTLTNVPRLDVVPQGRESGN